MRPRLLRPDNFTPPTRTPWGGRRILDHYKRDLDLRSTGDIPACGESWEVSVEPSFPSSFADDDTLLGDAIRAAPADWLGPGAAARGEGQTPLLVKLLDARENLSVQVHPADGDPALGPDESGKTEAWYVLDARDSAGIYLGFRDGVTRDHVERCLRSRGRLDDLMNFVPIAPGDAFVLEPGTVHAISAGATLLEPQVVTPGRRGVTYRYWDWNRLYDDRGVRCDDRQAPDRAMGKARPLHIERALAVTDWAGPRGQTLVASCRSKPALLTGGSLRRELVATSSRFVLERWAGMGALRVAAAHTLVAAVCVAGSAELRTSAGNERIERGQSMVIPAAAGDIEVTAAARHGDSGVELLVTRATD